MDIVFCSGGCGGDSKPAVYDPAATSGPRSGHLQPRGETLSIAAGSSTTRRITWPYRHNEEESQKLSKIKST